MKFFSYNICAFILACLLTVIACSRETAPDTEVAGSRVLKSEQTAILFKDIDPGHQPNGWQLPVERGREYISFVKYWDDSSTPGDSVSAVIYDPSRDEFEIFTLGGQADSMLGHRILGTPTDDKTISVFVPKWPGNNQCSTGKPDHQMEGDKHIVTFTQNCSPADSTGIGSKRRLQFEITVR